MAGGPLKGINMWKKEFEIWKKHEEGRDMKSEKKNMFNNQEIKRWRKNTKRK